MPVSFPKGIAQEKRMAEYVRQAKANDDDDRSILTGEWEDVHVRVRQSPAKRYGPAEG
jgi:hypothetical protein